MIHEFISPKGRYHQDSGHIADNPALCDWAGESQSKLHIVKEHFKHYLVVLELLSLSYCYTFV
jgi:hypothetical protein